MVTRCKFKCIAEIKTAEGYEYKFEPVTSGSVENEDFFRWTPYGSLSFGVVAERQFEPGKEYYLDISASE